MIRWLISDYVFFPVLMTMTAMLVIGMVGIPAYALLIDIREPGRSIDRVEATLMLSFLVGFTGCKLLAWLALYALNGDVTKAHFRPASVAFIVISLLTIAVLS